MALAAMRCRMSQMADPEALQDELKNLSRCYPGWRWEEEGETLHVWVRVAQDTQSHDVKFRVFGDRVSLVVKSTKVFDSLRVLTDLEADECFWTLESDSARGGARSVHLWLKRCCETSSVKVEDVCFRDALPPALYTTKVFGGQEPKRPVKKKKKKATTKETIVQVGAPARRVVKPPQQVDLFYGVPTCSDEGWSIVSGPAMKSTESGLLVLPPLDAESASAERVEFFEEKGTLRQKTCVFNPFLQLGFT